MKVKLTAIAFSFLIFLSGCGSQPLAEIQKDGSVVEEPKLATDLIQSNNNSNQNTMEFDTTKQYTAVLHTDKGDIEIALNKGQTPNTVKNFVDLAQKKFYDDTIFHRVIKDFMIQGGDPEGNGTGGPGYRFDDESFAGEYTRGTVAMANAGPDTNGSQFFVMVADYPLSPDYSIFGKVVEGLDIAKKISNMPRNPSDRPNQEVKMIKVTVE